jgi:HAD superfamily hydrolase (TIGR01509 family)
MSRFALVVLDCDGVLVDTERLTVGVEARLLTELGWPHTEAEVVARWMGRSSAAQLAEVTERLGAPASALFDERVTAEVHEAFDRELTAVEGVPELLDHLEREGVPTCVASSGTHDRIRRTLGLTGLLPRLEGRIHSATDVAHGKPAPDLFLHAAAAMDTDPGDCAVVEDSVPGVRAGVAAGMTVFGYAGGLTPAEELRAAGAQPFDRMTDLVDLL